MDEIDDDPALSEMRAVAEQAKAEAAYERMIWMLDEATNEGLGLE